MQRRIIGGIAGWLIGVLPLIGVNAAAYTGVYINPILALLVGLLLGSAGAGYIGGKSDGQAAGGSAGAMVAGGISGTLYAVSLALLLVLAQSLGVLGSILSGQLFYITIAILFLTALWLGIAVLTGLLTGTHTNRREKTPSAPRAQVPPPGYPSYRQEASVRYTGSAEGSPSRGAPPVAQRREGYGSGRSAGDGGFYDRYEPYDPSGPSDPSDPYATGDAYDRYQPGNLGAGYPAGQRQPDRDPRRR